MTKEKTISIIINTLEQFKIETEYLSCKMKDGKVGFKFKICSKINAEEIPSCADDIRIRLACRDKVKIIVIDEETFGVILPKEFGEEKRITMGEISENDTDYNPIDKKINIIKKYLKDGKTSDMLTLMKALDSEYDKYDKQVKFLEEDEDYLQVLEYAVRKGSISISEIQRQFNIGYVRAGMYIDDFENKGYISTSEGGKKRKVIITEEEFNKKREGD